jgi:transposase-like protein
MGKFSYEDKLQAVNDYLEGKESYRDIGNRIGTDHKSIVKWVALYNAHGPEGLKFRYTNYSTQFKIDVLNYMNEKGTSIGETAAIFNIPAPSTLLQWKEQLETLGLDALEQKKKGRPSMKNKNGNTPKNPDLVEGSIEALQAENERLRMENAYLKKLNALVQNKEKSPNKTKRK